MTVTDYSMPQDIRRPRSFPIGSGLTVVGAAMMIAGALGPWVGGRFFGGTHGVELGGDGWLVVAAAVCALVPLILPLPASALKGVWVIGLAIGGGFVCWTHFSQADVDGFNVDWGLQLAAVGCVVLGLSGLRLLVPRT